MKTPANEKLTGLEGKVAIVTGAAGEIGRVISAGLDAHGAKVVWAGRHERALRTAALGSGAKRDNFLTVRADMRLEQDVRRMVSATLDRFGRVDILINNAGTRGPTVPVTKLALKAWNEVMESNLTGAFLCARECLKHMTRRREGRIINISSVIAHMAYPLRASYASSKWGMIGLTRTLAQEAGPFNVQVNAICPGPVDGPRLEAVIASRAKALSTGLEDMRRQFMRPSALGRMVTAEDVSGLVLFLCSDAGSNITGQIIDVSAGYGLWPGA